MKVNRTLQGRIMQPRTLSSASDRRQALRFDGRGLLAHVAGTLVDLHDISVGGVKITMPARMPEGAMAITLYPHDGLWIDFDAAIEVKGTLVAREAEALRIRFDDETEALSRLIVRHANRRQRFVPRLVAG